MNKLYNDTILKNSAKTVICYNIFKKISCTPVHLKTKIINKN